MGINHQTFTLVSRALIVSLASTMGFGRETVGETRRSLSVLRREVVPESEEVKEGGAGGSGGCGVGAGVGCQSQTPKPGVCVV